MNIAFFITDTGELYGDMDATSLDEEAFHWLSENQIDMGRRSSFTVTRESPMFTTLGEAETWLTENCFQNPDDGGATSDIDPVMGPNETHYQECARLAHQVSEIVAMARLGELLPMAREHSYLCQVGIWFWSIGHRQLALMTYQRSIDLRPEAATYFNLAVCHDDLGNLDEAVEAMSVFYKIVPSADEQEQAEVILQQNGKGHLIRS